MIIHVFEKVRRIPALLGMLVVTGYQAILRPFLIGSCHHVPTCSQYAMQALDTHGLLRGGWIAFKRLIRCHPFAPGGYDPVPLNEAPTKSQIGPHLT